MNRKEPGACAQRSGLAGVALTLVLPWALGACVVIPQGPVAQSPPSKAPPLSSERIAQIVASPDRSAADRANDARRKPEEMLAFIGVRPGMNVLDLNTGGGYTTELLARAVRPSGRVYGQSAPLDADPAPLKPVSPESDAVSQTPSAAAAPGSVPPAAARRGGPPNSPAALAERSKSAGAGNIVSVVRKFEDPFPPEVASNKLDLVTLMFNYHDLAFQGVDRARMNRAVYEALKPGGMYVIADHSGRPGTGMSEAGTLHRIEQTFVRSEVEAAGFRFVAEGNFLRNPNDPRDKNTPEPPQPKDEFVMKFVKP